VVQATAITTPFVWPAPNHCSGGERGVMGAFASKPLSQVPVPAGKVKIDIVSDVF